MRRAWALGLILLFALAALLLRDWGTTQRDAPLHEDAKQAEDRPPPLLTASEETQEHAEEPGLTPRVLPAATEDAVRGPVTIVVVGPDDVPLPGLFVGLTTAASTRRRAAANGPYAPEGEVLETDALGEVFYADLPYDGSVLARMFRVDPRSPETSGAKGIALHGAAGYARAVRGERVILRASMGVWLETQVVAADDGAPRPRARVAMPEARASVDGGRRHLVMRPPARERTLALKVDAPEGWVAWDAPAWPVTISPYARRLVLVYPLRREVDVVLTVLEHDGRPASAAEIHRMTIAGRHVNKPRHASDTYGRLRILGVPFLRGELLSLSARRSGAFSGSTVEERVPDSPDRALNLEVTLPAPSAGDIGIGGGAGGTFSGRRSGRHTLRASGGHGRPKGGVVVSVRRRDGTPATGANVELAGRKVSTDERGLARFTRIHPGEYAVRVKQVGLLPLTGTVRVKGEETTRLVLREGPGSRLEVEVVDEAGRPLPYARLALRTASGLPWIDLVAGTQRLDPYTDHRGRRELHGVEPGAVTVFATWGSRRTSVSVDATSEAERPVRIVLPRP